MKPCLIHHPAGIGDIFYLQTVARKYISMGYDVVWPVRDDLLWLSDYIPDINFVSENGPFPLKEQYWKQDVVLVSPQFAYLGITRPHLWNIGDNMIMSSKYHVLQMNSDSWREGFTFKRNIDKENDLYYNILGLKDDDKYVYVNSYYNTDNYVTDMFVGKEFKYPIVENEIYEGFTPFDWIKVFQNAQEIHTRPTSVSFIIDVIDTKAEVYYYTFDQENYDQVSYIFRNVKSYA